MFRIIKSISEVLFILYWVSKRQREQQVIDMVSLILLTRKAIAISIIDNVWLAVFVTRVLIESLLGAVILNV